MRDIPSPAFDGAGRVRLLELVSALGRDGSEQQAVSLGLALDAKRFAVDFACLRRYGRASAEVAARGIPIREFALRRLGRWAGAWQQVRLARHMSQRRIQIVHTYNFEANVFGIPAAWVAGAPVIIASIRDRGSRLSRFQRHLHRQVCRLADCVLVNADATKNWLIDGGYDPGRIVVVRNGVDVARFASPRHTRLRQELDIPEAAPIVTMVSELTPMKGIEDFIDAAAILSWTHPDARFLVVGGADTSAAGAPSPHACRLSVAERVARLGLASRVFLMGHRPDVPALLAEAALSVLPSLSEGLSNVVLESMAAGVPVVATRVGGAREAVDDGVTGVLVAPSDPQGLAESMARLLADRAEAHRIGAAGRRAVAERFGMDRMVHATEQLYLDLLVRKAVRPDWRCRIGLAPPVFAPLAGKRS